MSKSYFINVLFYIYEFFYYTACLQRLNDPSSDIRILAAAVIPKLRPKFVNEEFDRDIWLAFIKNSFDLLFLHYDTPEKRLKKTIKGI